MSQGSVKGEPQSGLRVVIFVLEFYNTVIDSFVIGSSYAERRGAHDG
jgi:hypothetical protein